MHERCRWCSARPGSVCKATFHARYCELLRMEAEGEREGTFYTDDIRGGSVEVAVDAADEPALPSAFRQAWNFAKAVVSHVTEGMPKADAATVSVRLSACEGCEMFRASDRRCSALSCGCYVDDKASWADQSCPLGKWPAVTPSP